MTASVTLPAAVLSLLLAAAATDAKTGLLTHAAWQSTATHTLSTRRPGPRAARWALLMIDLDHFKRLNDRYGHPGADDLLRQLATTLRAASPPDAVLGRFGGDEFTVLLPVTDLTDLHRCGEHLRRTVHTASVTITGPSELVTVTGITASIGGALHPDTTSDTVSNAASGTGPRARPALAELLWTADRALYEAKHAGRNTTRVRTIDNG